MPVINQLPTAASQSLIPTAKQPKAFHHLNTYHHNHIWQFLDDS